MKRFLIAPALAAALLLSGCGAGSKVGGFVDAVTTTIVNPVDAVDIYRSKTVYVATLEIANGYREFCWSKPYTALMADPVAKPICRNRRQNIRNMQAADRKAYAAIVAAENFVRNNPTLNATSALGAAWVAVTDFQRFATNAAGATQ